MKILNLAILMALGLSVPFGAMSLNDSYTHKHTVQIHEISQDSVMKWILVPDRKYIDRQLLAKNSGAGSGKKTANGTKKQFQKREKKQLKKGQGEGEMDRERTQDQDQDQDQLMTRDQDQNRLRNND